MRSQEMPKEGAAERAARLEGRIKRAAWCLWVIAALFLIDQFPHLGNIAAAIFYAVSAYFILKGRNLALMLVAGAILLLGALLSLVGIALPPTFGGVRFGYMPAWLYGRLFLEFLFALFLFRAAQAALELKRSTALIEASAAID